MLKYKHLSLLLAAAAFLVAVGLSRPAEAHTDGKLQLAAAPAGIYKITAWTSPDPAEVGEIHVALAIVLAEDASPVLDAQAQIEMIPDDGAEPLSAPATTENSENKFLYEAVMDVNEAGRYQVVITIDGADGQQGQAAFDIEVSGASGLNWLLPLAGFLLVVVVIVIWLVRRRPAAA